MLADTHCHLDFYAFDDDRQEVLARSWQAGVERILDPGIHLVSSQKAVQLAEEHNQVYAAVGVHPNDAQSWEQDSLTRLKDLAGHPKVVAIGEIGLDYYRDRAPRDLQRRILLEQLDLAAELNLPVVIHNRQASADVMAILAEWQAQLAASGSGLAEQPGVLHSYSDNEEIALRAIAHHFLIGFTGPVTFRNAPELQRVAAALPLDHLLVETDAPFLSPQPHRGRRNEPSFVRLIAEKIAELHHVELDTVARLTAANAARLFHW